MRGICNVMVNKIRDTYGCYEQKWVSMNMSGFYE